MQMLNPTFVPTRKPALRDTHPGTPSAPILHGDLVERLRDRMIHGDLTPGTKLNERVLCGELGVSRTPLREALKALASEGLVELLPNRGAVVATLDAERVKQIFVVMGALEALAGELACLNATDADLDEIRGLHYQMVAHFKRGEREGYFRCNQAIHRKIVACGGNLALAQTYAQLNAHVRRARYLANLSADRWARAIAEHEQMLEAITARDAGRLKQLLQDHLAHKLVVVMEALLAQSNPPSS
jgi:DNA-binding GntR family transcriptional regulator